MNYKYKVIGQKQKKRDPIFHSQTEEEIDNGQNLPIVLTQGNDKKVIDYFINQLKEKFTKREWKFWIEENNNE